MKAKQPSGEVLSRDVLLALQSKHPEIVTGSWRKSVLDAFSALVDEEDFDGVVQELGFLPDAHVVNVEERFIHFFEIEVYHPMPNAKLEAYAKFAMDMDYYDIELGVLVVNKYGHINAVDLMPYYWAWVSNPENVLTPTKPSVGL